MADVARFRSRGERKQLALVREMRQLLLDLPEHFPADRIEAVQRELDAIEQHADGWRFMQVNGDREAEIIASLRSHTREPHTALAVLIAVRNALGFQNQRIERTQAEIGAALGLNQPATSRAFKALALAGAIMAPIRERGSQTWEVDATFATKLTSDARAAEAARQARMRATATVREHTPDQRRFSVLEGGAA